MRRLEADCNLLRLQIRMFTLAWSSLANVYSIYTIPGLYQVRPSLPWVVLHILIAILKPNHFLLLSQPLSFIIYPKRWTMKQLHHSGNL
jgi:hypothetical protein